MAIGVASGENKVRPILGALRAGIVRTLVTDVATAEAVVALDEATPDPIRRRSAMTAREPAILGLDLGTTEVKAGLVTLDGRLLALARSGYGLDTSGGHGWVEQDPGAWWSAVVSAVRALRAADLAEVVAIGVDGHGPTLVAVDARGEATRPAITFLDSRATAEAARARARDRRPGLVARRACPRRSGSSATNRRSQRRPAGTSRPGSGWPSVSPGSPTRPLVPNQVMADPAVVAAAGVPADRLPPRSAMGSVVGGLTETAADALGLRARDPGRQRDRGRVRELSRRRPSRTRRRLRPGWLGGRVRGLLGSSR